MKMKKPILTTRNASPAADAAGNASSGSHDDTSQTVAADLSLSAGEFAKLNEDAKSNDPQRKDAKREAQRILRSLRGKTVAVTGNAAVRPPEIDARKPVDVAEFIRASTAFVEMTSGRHAAILFRLLADAKAKRANAGRKKKKQTEIIESLLDGTRSSGKIVLELRSQFPAVKSNAVRRVKSDMRKNRTK